MVTMVTNKICLINFTFYETVRDEPIPHKNFTLLGQGNHEITGGGRPDLPPSWHPMWVPIPLVNEGLSLQKILKKFRKLRDSTILLCGKLN